jgi:alkylation response protein AidB-like acyl-CoA dehydrogenase
VGVAQAAMEQAIADPLRQTALRWNIKISRILCDARILSIFEGAAEIQAQVIARRLPDGRN